MAKEIKKLIDDENLRIRYIKKAKEFFNKKFDAKIMASAYEKLYLRKD